jgi:aspartate 1-decarboxylase
MLIEILKSKIHNATITKRELSYEGSIGIDRELLAKSYIVANQKVQVVNFNNGARFETYVIAEKENSGEIALYGPAARQAEIGDKLCIMAYGMIGESRAESAKPRVIILDEKNEIKS